MCVCVCVCLCVCNVSLCACTPVGLRFLHLRVGRVSSSGRARGVWHLPGATAVAVAAISHREGPLLIQCWRGSAPLRAVCPVRLRCAHVAQLVADLFHKCSLYFALVFAVAAPAQPPLNAQAEHGLPRARPCCGLRLAERASLLVPRPRTRCPMLRCRRLWTLCAAAATAAQPGRGRPPL
jgi:hypothetical protein